MPPFGSNLGNLPHLFSTSEVHLIADPRNAPKIPIHPLLGLHLKAHSTYLLQFIDLVITRANVLENVNQVKYTILGAMIIFCRIRMHLFSIYNIILI
jgi:hypothetical protein